MSAAAAMPDPGRGTEEPSHLGRRPADAMMGLERARAVVPDALSFPRAAMRELVRGRWQVDKLRFELDEAGRGEILYRMRGAGRVFHFFLVSDLLPEAVKTDRNFAASWDAMGVLCQGEWTPEREALLRREVPLQRAGFADYGTLIYARGNRSARIFNHVVDSLAQGRQPDLAELAPVGYILRTTAFIGNGQLGTLPLEGYDADHPLRRPYHAQFASAFMLREYVFDLVDHLARIRSPHAVRLAPEYRRYLGLGNSAATGLAAYATNHPHQMHRWSLVHEDALVEAVRRAPVLPGEAAGRFAGLLARAARHFDEGARPADGVFAAPQETASQLRAIEQAMQSPAFSATSGSGEKTISLEALVRWARAHAHAEAVEVLHSLVLELYPDIAESAVDGFLVGEDAATVPGTTVAGMRALIERDFGWALVSDAAARDDDDPYYFWYRASSAPRDVRRGVRRRLGHLEFETNMDFGLQLREAHALLRGLPPGRALAEVLCERPDLRHAIARAQSLAGADYAALRQPWLSRRYTPFEAIRFVLAFYGMEKFEAAFPKSVRGTFMQGAPIAEDVAAGRDGRWPFTLKPDPEHPGAQHELAPLPATAGHDTKVTRAAQPPERQLLALAPRELARAVQTALQGHGMPLGVAAEAGALVAFAECGGAPGVAAALRHCAARRVARYSAPAPAWPGDGDLVVLDAHGASSLAMATIALDLALERCAQSPRRAGAVLVVNALDAWLAKALVLRGAREGRRTVLLWRACEEDGRPRQGYAAGTPRPAGEGREGAQRARTHHGDDAWYEEGPLTAEGEGIADTLARGPGWTPLQGDGFLIACQEAGTPPRADDVQAFLRTGAQIAADAARQGAPLSRADYDALLAAGAALLVPQSVEHLVLHEGNDPLKSF